MGLARRYAPLVDGRRHILDFLLPGDWFGASARVLHDFEVDAVPAGTLIARYPRVLLQKTLHDKPRARMQLLAHVFEGTGRIERNAVRIAAMSAHERVGSFLVELTDRMLGGSRVALPMSRYDMADHLGLSVETVSRVLGQLQQEGAIALESPRRIRILDRDQLAGTWPAS
jgi:CRP/FNR family transcriptional regulator, nitrogen fixation regulation protein